MPRKRHSRCFANRYMVSRPYSAFSRKLIDTRSQTLEVQDDLLHNASLLDEVDLCLGFAQVADELRFIRPHMDNR
jgi:DNA mismatch repair ATPase MutS